MSFLFRLDLLTDHELSTMNSPPRPPSSWKELLRNGRHAVATLDGNSPLLMLSAAHCMPHTDNSPAV